MTDQPRKNTLMQLQVSLPKEIAITAAIMAVLILFVFYCNIPNPNMILIAGLVLSSALFGYGGGVTAAVIMFGYTLFFFSTDHSFTQFTPQNMQKVFVSVVGIVADMVFVCALKRAELQEFKVVDALTAQLSIQKESLSSLLNHMPAMSFYKDAKTGVYLACNQAFAEYAHKKDPSGVEGLTDFEIFDPVTAGHFAEDDKKALSMEEPYIFFEDVPDAAGNQRQFQTTKLKFFDETGRLCLLGMCMDVSEVVRIRKENEQTKAAYQEALSAGAVYKNVVNALMEDYFNLYYVDLETNDYIEYGYKTDQGRSVNGERGSDFFAQVRKEALVYVYGEDQKRFLERMDREKLLKEIEKHGTLIYFYRLVMDGEPVYVSMKIRPSGKHIIIGVSNVDTQVKDRMAAAHAAEERKFYQRLAVLNGNLVVLYYVDLETNHYTEYSSSKEFAVLGISKEGSDFFGTTYRNSQRTIHPEDQALFHRQFTKENILAAIRRDGIFVLDYRLVMGEHPTYIRLKAAKVEEDGKATLIVGLLDEDAQIRQEKEYAQNLSAAQRMATVDPLTGVKNKTAYMQWEEKINRAIQEGTQEPFAVVVCDVNGLKQVNDLYGHKEGDLCIQGCCSKICKIFSHSPVFRTGGDEFIVFLTGADYFRRNDLMNQANALPRDHSKIRMGKTISAGIAEYDRERHDSLLSVTEEADKAMYERKQHLKEAVLKQEGEPESVTASDFIPVIHAHKHVLIVDDIEMNRKIMGALLAGEYDVSYASDGAEALNALRNSKGEIDLVLLDLQMPNMSGREVIAQMQIDEELMFIPVIILTVDQDAELDCLKIGAMDFIPKPFPDVEIVKARIDKCIELAEDRELIHYTERDKITGLLNKDYFFRYVGRLDHLYRETGMDAVACDVNKFHAINKQYGRQFGEKVLRSMGAGLKKLARQIGGISCREEDDTFLLYCPHQENYGRLIREFLSEVCSGKEMADIVSIRFGVCVDAWQMENIEERFECAKTAADEVRNDPKKICGFYERV